MSTNSSGAVTHEQSQSMKYGAMMLGRMITALIAIMVLIAVSVAFYWTKIEGNSLPIRVNVGVEETALP